MSNTASYIGKEPQYGVFITQTETGDGSTVAFTLDATAATTSSLLVSVGGVVQQPAVAYNINSAGTTLTFTGAPGSSEPIWILFLGQVLQVPQATSANTTMITGESALGTAPAAGDYFLLYDADAAAMKKVAYSNLETGDISSVVAGTGLSGGGTTGAVTLNVEAAQTQITSLGTIGSLVATTADINAGTVDAVIGGTTPAAGTFTTLIGTNVDGIIGANTPAAVTATTVASSSTITANAQAQMNNNNFIGTNTGATCHIIGKRTSTGDGIAFQTTNTSGTDTNRLTISGNATTATFGFLDQIVAQPALQDYAEIKTALSAAASVTIDLTTGNVFTITPDQNTTFVFSNPPVTGRSGSFTLIWTQDSSDRSITWPTSVDWAGGSAPDVTSGSGKRDVYTFFTLDAGTIWYGFQAGAEMS